jgi:hypothetical protein
LKKGKPPVPFFKAAGKLVYYAHVPKCGGSAIAHYLQDRFGELGFYDSLYHRRLRSGTPWTRTSPQHVDAETLGSVLPVSLFDEIFAVVRHPVPRTVSTYHFQREVEGRIPDGVSFSRWLEELEARGFEPFEYDNHVLPMHRLIPEGAQIFHLEHGLDALVAWLDLLTGREDPPRAVLHENARGAVVKVDTEKVVPTPEDVARIKRIYAPDFERFGYDPDGRAPAAAPPEMTPAFMARRGRALRRMNSLPYRLARRVRRRLGRL